MSRATLRGPGWGFLTLVVLAAGLVSGSRATAAAGDLLKQAQAQNEVQAQKLEADVARVLADCRRLEQTDPTKAINLLKNLRGQIEDANGLSAARQNELLRLVDGRLRTMQTGVRQRQEDQDKATAQAIERQRQQEFQQPTRPGPNPVETVNKFIGTARDGIDSQAKYKAQRDATVVAINRDVERTFANTPTGDLTFSPNHKLIKEMREASSGPKLTPEEKACVKALASTMSTNFDKTSLKDALEYLQERTNVTILVDKNSLQEANVEYDDPVSLVVKKATVKTILRKILGDRNLTYIIKDGVIQVVTPQKARETMVVRSYSIDGLLPQGAIFNRAVLYQSVQQIIDTIQNSVEPGSWAVNGGTGTISFNEATRSLIIRNSAELHYSMPFGGISR